MNIKIMAIKDTKSGFVECHLAQNNVTGMRQFGDMVNQQGTLINKHSEDFELYELGELDDQSGKVTPGVKYLARANEFKEEK